jgi:hypothetical protein
VPSAEVHLAPVTPRVKAHRMQIHPRARPSMTRWHGSIVRIHAEYDAGTMSSCSAAWSRFTPFPTAYRWCSSAAATARSPKRAE